jgi:hypothetical protein
LEKKMLKLLIYHKFLKITKMVINNTELYADIKIVDNVQHKSYTSKYGASFPLYFEAFKSFI